MEVFYRFLEEKQLLIQKASGEWCMDKYKKHVQSVFMLPRMKDIKLILTDLREINLEKAFQDLDTLMSLREKMVNLNYKSVVLVSTSSTVVTHLYQSEVNAKGFQQAYCSTVKKAIDLLNLDMSEAEMDVLFSELNEKH